jgi:hypothetical protein
MELVLPGLEIVIRVRRFVPCQRLLGTAGHLPCPAHDRAGAGGMDPVSRETPGSWTTYAERCGSGATATTHLLEDGYDMRTMQERLGHRDVRTTMLDTHVLNRGGSGVRSPVERL